MMRSGVLLGALAAAWGATCAAASAAEPSDAVRSSMPGSMPGSASVVSLDGDAWLLAVDPKNAGRKEQWFAAVRPGAKRTKVPWIIQDAFPGYHGVAWYWRTFDAPVNPRPNGRTLLRFWAVDYTAEVWLNGQRVGAHEGGETPFLLDVTGAVRPGLANLLAVRVLNPTHEPIDGIVLNETPHRNKALPYSSGSAWNQGGIIDSVELVSAPAARIDDLFVQPDWKTGKVRIQATLHNAGPAGSGRLMLATAPAAGGNTVAETAVSVALPQGSSVVEAGLSVARPRLWDLSDPFLYRVTARLAADAPASRDEFSVRCGFRDFRFENGAFRLNGRRIYLRCSHTGNCCPIGLELPHDPDFLRRDLINAKAMRFNAIRFIAGVAKRYQLDLCDEIGLMVYEEAYASWCMADSPKMPERFDESLLGMIRRDRNHPSVTMWGLLNETSEGPVFRHAVGLLPAVRRLDPSRIVMLNSGRFDNAAGGALAGIEHWNPPERVDPCVTMNPTDRTIRGLGIAWEPGRLAFHPGRGGEYAVVRWTAPEAGKADVACEFASIAENATTDIHVLHNGKPLFEAGIHVAGGGPKASYRGGVQVARGDTLDCVCGYGNGHYGADTTGLTMVVRQGQKSYDAARQFSCQRNPDGAWSFGMLPPSPKPKADAFVLFRGGGRLQAIGGLSNPGSREWEDVLSDQHPYQRVPHTAEIIRTLRTLDGKGQPVFLSEYGIGSGTDLVRVVRQYEQAGKADVEDAQLYRAWRDQFLEDYRRWGMADTFPRPEDFFAASIQRMAAQRLLGLNAIRANPNVIGHSLTGTLDQGMTSEGLWTTFRELKPGTTDAVFDGFAPLRLCLFAEPAHIHRKGKIRLEAVLANEDALSPGKYPVRLHVIGPDASKVIERTVAVTIPERKPGKEPPMVQPVFSEEIAIDAPTAKYRFTATFQRGAAAAGGETEFYVTDPADMPPVAGEIVLWGDDRELAAWLAAHGIRTRPFAAQASPAREAILVGARPAPGGASAFAELAGRIARGSTVVFLSPEVFARDKDPAGWLPLAKKGAIAGLASWLYHKDEWCKRHPIFDGLPSGGLMDYTFYREIIPDGALVGQDPPDETIAAGNNVSLAYSSGVLMGVYRLGAGKFVVHTLRIRENLAASPVAERLLRNLLRLASTGVDKPAAALPADWDVQLRAMGYGP
jgi:hypothetical protein